MKTFKSVLAFLCVACLTQVAAYTDKPEPGALELYFNTT